MPSSLHGKKTDKKIIMHKPIMQRKINHRWLAAEQLEKIKNNSSCSISSSVNINRRFFLTASGVSLLSAVIPSCAKPGTEVITEALIQELDFQHFFDVIFPAGMPGLEHLRQPALKRLQYLKPRDALLVTTLYQRFKHQLWKKNLFSSQTYTYSFADQCVAKQCFADILQSDSKHSNEALDIIYVDITKVEGFNHSIWGRKMSLYNKKCAYWNNYDIKPVS